MVRLVCTALLVALLAAAPALAADVELRPRYRPGDTYALSIRKEVATVATARGGERDSFDEKVDLHYRATVDVLAVDQDGRPLRERHRGARFTFERPDDSGSMFRSGTTFEVRRDADGRVSLFVQGDPVDPRIQQPVAELLETQFEYGVGPALIDPGRRVALGESWPLDRALSRRFLRDHGVRVMKLGEGARATLRREGDDPDGALRIAYEIPVDWFVLERMPPNARAAETTASFGGEIRLPEEPGASLDHTATLELDMNGIAGDAGAAHLVPWQVRSRSVSRQRSVRVEPVASRGGEPAVDRAGAAIRVSRTSPDAR